jgi:hypothetical protein
VEEVEGYARKKRIGTPRLVRRFYDGKVANGWKVGKNPMKDWQAAYRNFVRAIEDDQQGNGKRGGDATGNDAVRNLLARKGAADEVRRGGADRDPYRGTLPGLVEVDG